MPVSSLFSTASYWTWSHVLAWSVLLLLFFWHCMMLKICNCWKPFQVLKSFGGCCFWSPVHCITAVNYRSECWSLVSTVGEIYPPLPPLPPKSARAIRWNAADFLFIWSKTRQDTILLIVYTQIPVYRNEVTKNANGTRSIGWAQHGRWIFVFAAIFHKYRWLNLCLSMTTDCSSWVSSDGN